MSRENKKGPEQSSDPTSTYEKHTLERVRTNIYIFLKKDNGKVLNRTKDTMISKITLQQPIYELYKNYKTYFTQMLKSAKLH